MELQNFRRGRSIALLCTSLVLLSLLLYWFIGVRPYIRIEKARLTASTVDVRSESAGRLASLHAAEGSWVKEGEILFSLSAEKEEAMQAELFAKINSLHQTLSGHLSSAEEAMQEYLNARSDEAMGIEDQSEFPLVKMQQEQEMAEKCKLQISLAQQELESMKAKIQEKNRVASCSGFVVKREKQEGELLQAGDRVYSLCNPKKMWIEATVPERFISKIKIGQKVFAHLSSDSSYKWEGIISWVSPVALSDEQGVLVRISLGESLPDFLRPNLTVQLKVKVQ